MKFDFKEAVFEAKYIISRWQNREFFPKETDTFVYRSLFQRLTETFQKEGLSERDAGVAAASAITQECNFRILWDYPEQTRDESVENVLGRVRQKNKMALEA